ncbi:hypothetical protein E4U17_003736 [Claviceps sp. LM77 group G4]|nr:hypothetical protein E4U17_003736 [Claviceps sp. LM77 group G4]KAG6072147.1 hypothetical protein E4U16_005600 [Claviceps sp. LM84 group G4]KAG6080809.1 hypothetical protein E4U33_007265 [Claviceps sp. LM78 group G4]
MPNRPRPKSWCESGRSTRRNSTSSYHDGYKMQTTLGPCVETCSAETLQERRCVSSTPSLLEAQKIEVDATSEQTHDGVDAFDPQRPKLGLKQRLHHFTWAWYTLPMSTGGLALLIRSQPHRFPGLDIIGLIVYILNLIIFTTISCLMVARFSIHSGDMSKSIKHPREGFFLPTFFLSVATIITSTDRYVIPKHDIGLVWAVSGAFWAYVAVTLLLAIGQYSYVFAAHRFELHTMMPTWILPIFPIMLSGTIASVIAETQPQAAAIPIIVAGLTCQGLGFAVAVLMYAHMVGRLMSAGLPNREHRPGLFMCVGPPAFTALALVGMAKGLPANLDTAVDGRFFDTAVVRTMALMSAIFLWSLSLWWFGIAAVAVIQSPPKHFHLGWWAMVFPNTGFILATISIGRELSHDGVLWFATGLSICLVCTYLFVLFNHVKAVIKQDIMYPGRDEDIEDH